MWKCKKILKLMTAIGCLVCLSAVPAEAAQDSVSVRFPAQQELEKDSRREINETFEYVLKASEQESPMPGELQADSFSFSMTGNQHIQLDEILYTEPGIYRYEVSQDIPEKQKGYEYDDSRYRVEVHVERTSRQDLEATVVILNGLGEKCESLTFTNRYQDSTLPGKTPSKASPQKQGKPVKTGDGTELSFWLCLIAGSGSIALGSVFFSRSQQKRKKKED